MPTDRHLDDNGLVILDEPEPTATNHHSPEAIAGCELCDDDGYRGGIVCDHVNHAAETEKARALARAELAKVLARKGKGA